MEEGMTREHFLQLIGHVRANGAFPDEPLLAVYDGLRAALELVEKELKQRKGWQYCQTHEKINADYAWGCPDCVHVLRHELAQATAKIAELEGIMKEAASMAGQRWLEAQLLLAKALK